MKNSDILKYAKEYLISDITISQVASNNGVSRKSLQSNLKKLKDIDPELYKLVEEKKANNQVIGRKKGASKGKRSVSYSPELANEIAQRIISEQLTYEKAAEIFGIASSTIYEMVHSKYISPDTLSKLELVSICNIKNKTTEEYKESNKKNGNK